MRDLPLKVILKKVSFIAVLILIVSLAQISAERPEKKALDWDYPESFHYKRLSRL